MKNSKDLPSLEANPSYKTSKRSRCLINEANKL